MSLIRHLRHGLRRLLARRAADQDAVDEVAHWLEQATAAHLARGLSPSDARRAARLELGSATAVREEVRSYGWENLVDTLLADLRYALRMLRRSPIFAGVAVLVVALGTGAVTTIFSALNAIALRPLPAASEPRRLVGIDRRRPDADDGIQASYQYFDFLRRNTRSLEGLAAWANAPLTISAGAEGLAAHGNLVSGNYFAVLGVRPALGRFFTPEEDRSPLTHPVLVLGHSFWRTRLGADSGIVGRVVTVNGYPLTVIGVAPAEFPGVFTPLRVDAWVPLMMQPALRPARDLEHAIWLWTFGRLGKDADRAGAQVELARLTAQYIGARSEPADRAGYTAVRLAAMNGLPPDAHRMALGFIGLLLGAAALVLLIASVNVGSMLSARAIARRRELAVRSALGAGRARLARQLLTEILVLFLAGGAGGMLLALPATAALERFRIPADVPLVLEISPDGRVFAFTLLLCLATGLAFGLAPALRAAHPDLTDRLRDGAPGGGSRRRPLGNALIVSQLALSLVLLVAAGLFLRALDQGTRTDPGFDIAGVATASFNPEAWGYDRERGRAFYVELRRRVAGMPGVTAVSFTGNMPLAFATSNGRITLDPAEPGMEEGGRGEPIQLSLVDAGFFETVRIPVVSGRPLLASDDERAPRVAVINQTFARRFWPGGDALGRTFTYRGQPVTVVGVARDAKYGSLAETTPAFAYFPMAQRWQPTQILLVRTAGEPGRLGPAIEAAVLELDPRLPRPVVTTLRESTSIVLLPQRIAAAVTGALGAMGLLLATVGLYGIIAYSVGRRTREIGLRVALGADRPAVLRLIIGEGMRLAAAGVAVGLVLAAAASRLLAGLLFGLSPLDLPTFTATALLLAAVALLASYLPARRATAADPMAALRTD